MKSYDQTIIEIYQRANRYYTERKIRRTKVLLSVCPLLAVFLSLSISLCAFVPMMRNPGFVPPISEITDTGGTADSTAPNSTGEYSDNPEPDIFPHAWKCLNAVIVKWGEQTEGVWDETYSRYRVKYVEIEVEFVSVFGKTMTESLIPDAYNTIEASTTIFVPEYCLPDIVKGGEALIFLSSIFRQIVADENGNHLFTKERIGVRAGDCLGDGTFAMVPIFNIINGCVSVPKRAYDIDEKTGYYRMGIMNYLAEGNAYIAREGDVLAAVFEDKTQAEALENYFTYICGLE